MDLQKFAAFLQRQIEGAQSQHDGRASGAWGPERNTPEQLALWRGIKSGLEQALEELNMWLLAEADGTIHETIQAKPGYRDGYKAGFEAGREAGLTEENRKHSW